MWELTCLYLDHGLFTHPHPGTYFLHPPSPYPGTGPLARYVRTRRVVSGTHCLPYANLNRVGTDSDPIWSPRYDAGACVVRVTPTFPVWWPSRRSLDSCYGRWVRTNCSFGKDHSVRLVSGLLLKRPRWRGGLCSRQTTSAKSTTSWLTPTSCLVVGVPGDLEQNCVNQV